LSTPFWRDIVARDIETYLRDLQDALVAAGADPALVQDALFDAEEHLQSEMAAGGDFASVAEGYGSPEEVAAAYLGAVPVETMARAMNAPHAGAVEPAVTVVPADQAEPAVQTAMDEESVRGWAPAAAYVPATTGVAAPEAPDADAAQTQVPCPLCGVEVRPDQAFCTTCGARLAPAPAGAGEGPAPHAPASSAGPSAPPPPPGYPMPPYQGGAYVPAGVQYGMQAAGAGGAGRRSVWGDIFGPFADGRVWTSLVYMILSLATGVAYFTIVVTGLSTAGGMLVLIIGIPLFMAVLGIVRALALFEGRLVETLLGERMPRRLRATPPNLGFWNRMWFWLKDGRTWASMAYMILMLPLGIVYFTIAVTGFAVGISLVTAPIWGWLEWHFADHTFVVNGVTYDVWPLWVIPIAFVVGVLFLVGFMHLVRWIGRGHAAFAKAMLVRLK
jgi:hypothetical protein